MGTITTQDGTTIFYKDWGPRNAQPVVFHHGWPLSSDDWDAQMLYFLAQGYRVIAHDRRGHGRSSQVGNGHDMDHYADDLAAVVSHLDLRNAVHIGHSTGGGEAGAMLAGMVRMRGLLIISAPYHYGQTAPRLAACRLGVGDSGIWLAANALFYRCRQARSMVTTPGAKVCSHHRRWWRQGMMGRQGADGTRRSRPISPDLKATDIRRSSCTGMTTKSCRSTIRAASVKLLKNGAQGLRSCRTACCTQTSSTRTCWRSSDLNAPRSCTVRRRRESHARIVPATPDDVTTVHQRARNCWSARTDAAGRPDVTR